jgi:predicted exporter
MNELRAGPVARLTIITLGRAGRDALGGADRDALAASSKRLAARLRASGAFVRVANGEQLFDDAERDRLFAYRYLLSPAVNAERFTAASLGAALRTRLRELASPVPYFDRPWLARDPTAEMRAMLMAWRGQARPRSYRGVWFDAAGEHALLLAQTGAPGFDLDAQEAAQALIRDAVDGSVELSLSGPGVFAVTSREVVRADTRRLGLMAGVAALVILLVSYRSVRLLVIGGLPLLSAVAAGIVAVNGIFGAIHGIVLAFGITVIGVAIDYPIHLFSHLNAGESARRSLDSVWPTIRLGAITTAMGYLAMSGTEFPGLTQFATFAIAGLLAAAACTRWGIVAWLPAGFVPRYRAPFSDRYASSPRPGKAWAGLMLAAGAVAFVYLSSQDSAPWEDDIAALSPIPESVMARDRHLHAQLGVPDTNRTTSCSWRQPTPRPPSSPAKRLPTVSPRWYSTASSRASISLPGTCRAQPRRGCASRACRSRLTCAKLWPGPRPGRPSRKISSRHSSRLSPRRVRSGLYCPVTWRAPPWVCACALRCSQWTIAGSP